VVVVVVVVRGDLLIECKAIMVMVMMAIVWWQLKVVIVTNYSFSSCSSLLLFFLFLLLLLLLLLLSGPDASKTLWQKIEETCVKSMLPVVPLLQREYRWDRGGGGPHLSSACFAVIGVDLMVDSNLNPWLIEINHLPSFKTDTDVDKMIKVMDI